MQVSKAELESTFRHLSITERFISASPAAGRAATFWIILKFHRSRYRIETGTPVAVTSLHIEVCNEHSQKAVCKQPKETHMNLEQKNGIALITGPSTGIGATRADGLVQEREGTTILQSVLAALNEGKISQAVDQFDDRFTFSDHALDLQFTDKRRLSGFFQKSRELFPDTVVKVSSSFQCGDRVVAEWKLKATMQTALYGVTRFRFPIFVGGTSIVRVENGKITHWSDYYDQNRSWRLSLAAPFKEWIEY
jgi:hypothetical protein